MKKLLSLLFTLTIFLVFAGSVNAAPSDHFVGTWDTALDGGSPGLVFWGSTLGGGGTLFDIDWEGDLTFEDTGETTGGQLYDYGPDGTYTMRVDGEINHFQITSGVGEDSLTAITQWGTDDWVSLDSLFEGAAAAQITAADNPNLTLGPSFNQIFKNSEAMNNDLSGWSTGAVTNMSEAFSGSIFNQPLSSWDVSSVTNMFGMFSNSPFNQDISGWTTSAATDMSRMFSNNTVFNQPIGSWDVSSVMNMNTMFSGATAFDQSLAGWNIGNVMAMNGFLLGGGLSTANYDATLTAWGALPSLQAGVTLDMGTSTYCASSADRAAIIGTYGWTINDAGVDCNLTGVITAPTLSSSATITDTTIQVTDLGGVLAANVTVRPSTTAGTSGFSCVQTTALQVDCTINITSSGQLDIAATNTSGFSISTQQSSYVIDSTDPVPNMTIDTSGGVDAPVLTFSATDNVAVDHFELTYNTSNGLGGGVGPSTTDNPVTSPVTLTLDPDEAVHSVTLVTYDTVGNSASLNVLFPPVISFTTPTSISNATITDATFTITTPSTNDVININLTPGTTGATLGTCTGADLDTTSPWVQPVSCVVNTITSSGTITIDAEDAGNGAVGENSQVYVVETTDPAASITAPTKANNAAITNTTVQIMDNVAINTADVSISAVNTTGTFSVSTLSCTQTSTSQVDCTLQIDANEGTGDLRVTYTDVAGNSTTTDETGYVVDLTAPTTPVAVPDLQAGSDTGVSSTDNITSDSTPTIDVVCTEIGAALKVYSDNPAASTLVGVHTCVGIGSAAVITGIVPDGTHNITYTATDTIGNISLPSPILAVDLDTTVDPTTTTGINGDTGSSTNDQVTSDQSLFIEGLSEASASVEVFLDGISLGTTTADGSGNWTYDHTGTTLSEATYAVTVQGTDTTGNIGALSTAMNIIIDITPPVVAIDPAGAGDLVVTGTGEVSLEIDIAGKTCTPNPVLVDGLGIWTCSAVAPIVSSGETLVATITDLAGNIATASYIVPVTVSAKKSGGTRRVVPALTKTPEADTVDVPLLCSVDSLLTQNLRAGDRNGKFSPWQGGIITEVKILQKHMDRLGFSVGLAGFDGILGQKTKSAIQAMQQSLGLVPDGLVGKNTRSVINARCEKNNGDSGNTSLEKQSGDSTEFDIEAADVHCPHFTTYYKIGESGGEIPLIQSFLEQQGFGIGSVNGQMEQATFDAVKLFQDKYRSEILTPWGLTEPTGNWYQSTRKKANELLGCSEGSVVLDNGFILD